MEYNSHMEINAASYSTGKLCMDKKSSVKKISFEPYSGIDNTVIVTCVFLHTVRYIIVISCVSEEKYRSCDTIIHKIFVFLEHSSTKGREYQTYRYLEQK